ncbi:MaoC family dehydratase [Agathobaculum sp. TL06]
MSKTYTDVRYEDVSVGMEIPEVHFPLTSQKMVMFAGVNRDFSPIHTDSAYARQDGAKDMYANSMLIIALFERMLREWAGLAAKIKKIGPFRMKKFTCVGNVMVFKGTVCSKYIDEQGNKTVELDVFVETEEDGTTVVGKSMVVLQ